jgi:hypothetical protein
MVGNDNNIKIKLQRHLVSNKGIDYSLYTEDNIEASFRQELSRKIINLEDDFVRNSLIELGWTPPKDDKELSNDS